MTIKIQPRLTAVFLSLLVVMLAGCSGNDGSDEAIAALENRLQAAEAREAIRNLFTDYGRTLDSRNWDGFGALFARDSEYLGGGGIGAVKGPQAIADSLENIITANASGANLHMYFNEKIVVHADGVSASAHSRGAFYVQDEAGNPMPLIFATYVDEFVLEDGKWLFNKRQVLGDIPGPANETKTPLPAL